MKDEQTFKSSDLPGGGVVSGTDIEAIARGLSEAQREIMRNAPHPSYGWFPATWEGWRSLFCSLQRKGLAYAREPGMQTLSPLGLAVRSHLQATGVKP